MERRSPLLSFSIYQSADERLVSPGEKKKTHKSGDREAIFTHRVKIEAGEPQHTSCWFPRQRIRADNAARIARGAIYEKSRAIYTA